MLSSSEFEASRFLPCTPLQLVSPAAYRCSMVVLLIMSTRMPPIR